MESTDVAPTVEARAIPQAKGYKILIAMPEPKKKEGSILLPEDAAAREALAHNIGSVVALGPDCYADEKKFPSGPWCSVGDWVLFRSYAGTRFKIRGQEFRLINDDTVEAVIDDPREYSRA